jgi:predicted dehydrogenase
VTPAAQHRVAVVGAGRVSKLWFPSLLERPDVEIVALVEAVEPLAHEAQSNYGFSSPVYSDLVTAIGEREPNIVVNLTPPEHHRSVVGTALELGCHVFGEKPMAATLEEALELVALAESTGRVFGVMQQRRYVIGCRTLRDGIAAGRIGRPELICADYFMAPRFGGFRAEMDSPLLLDMAIHTFDQVRFITGIEPTAVYCHEFNPPSSRYRGSAAAVCIFECADGAVFSYRGSWAAEGCPTSWETEWRVDGDLGTAIWDGTGIPSSETAVEPADADALFWPVDRADWAPTFTGREGHAGCIDALFAAVEQGVKPETDCTDNVKSLVMVLAALESARRGERVLIADLIREATPR